MEVKVNSAPKSELIEIGAQVYIHWDKDDAVVIRSQSQEVFQVVDNPLFMQDK